MSTLKVNNITDLGNDAVVTSGILDTLAVPAGGILQVVSTTKTDAFSTSSTSYVDVTGLTVSVTPASATSKVLVSGHIQLNQISGGTIGIFQIVRDSNAIGIGDTASTRIRATGSYRPGDLNSSSGSTQLAFQFLDSPSTTSATAYKIQLRTNTGTIAVNTTDNNSDNAEDARAVSTITVMEVAG